MTVVFTDVMKYRAVSRNQVNNKELQNEEKRGIRRFTIDQDAYTHRFTVYKSHIRTHALSRKQKRVYLGKLNIWSEVFIPWYFDPWYWSKVSGPRY